LKKKERKANLLKEEKGRPNYVWHQSGDMASHLEPNGGQVCPGKGEHSLEGRTPQMRSPKVEKKWYRKKKNVTETGEVEQELI
jgi:hypothetical protein